MHIPELLVSASLFVFLSLPHSLAWCKASCLSLSLSLSLWLSLSFPSCLIPSPSLSLYIGFSLSLGLYDYFTLPLSLYSVFPLSRSVSLSDSLAIPHFLTLSPSVSFSFCLPLYTVVFIQRTYLLFCRPTRRFRQKNNATRTEFTVYESNTCVNTKRTVRYVSSLVLLSTPL